MLDIHWFWFGLSALFVFALFIVSWPPVPHLYMIKYFTSCQVQNQNQVRLWLWLLELDDKLSLEQNFVCLSTRQPNPWQAFSSSPIPTVVLLFHCIWFNLRSAKVNQQKKKKGGEENRKNRKCSYSINLLALQSLWPPFCPSLHSLLFHALFIKFNIPFLVPWTLLFYFLF